MAGAPPRSGENKKSAWEDRGPHGASADYSRVALTYESSCTSNSRSRLSYQYGRAPVKASQHPHKGQQPDPHDGSPAIAGLREPRSALYREGAPTTRDGRSRPGAPWGPG